MPTYEYECRKCGLNFEEVKPITAPPRRRCPQCRGKVQRLIGSGVGIVFKGSGFYVTDSRRGSGSRAGRSTSSDAAAEAVAKAETQDATKDKAKDQQKREKPSQSKASEKKAG